MGWRSPVLKGSKIISPSSFLFHIITPYMSIIEMEIMSKVNSKGLSNMTTISVYEKAYPDKLKIAWFQEACASQVKNK